MRILAKGAMFVARMIGQRLLETAVQSMVELVSAPAGRRGRSKKLAKPARTHAKSSARARSGLKWWKVLDVPQTASADEIKTAYREMMRQNHPDKVAHLSAKLRRTAEAETKRINAAHAEALAEIKSSAGRK